jgi:ring-1,2-phenylacetyl-CoA epoxidase subunit PaaC
MSAAADAAVTAAHIDYLLRLGDSSLVMGQRLGEWTGHGPVLEEDIAMSNIALDLLGQARLLLTLAGRLEGAGRDEDALAYFRDARAYRNYTLCELPNNGLEKGRTQSACYGVTMARNLFFCGFQSLLWRALCDSSDSELAAIAAKSAKETAYHLRHATDWVVRLGDGTEESHARMQRAVDQLHPYTNEFFAADPVEDALTASGIAVRGASLREEWDALVGRICAEATLALPVAPAFSSSGKSGLHSEHLDFLLAEMQCVARAHPGASW